LFDTTKLGLTRSAPDRLKIYEKSASSPYAASATSYYKQSNYRALVVFLTRYRAMHRAGRFCPAGQGATASSLNFVLAHTLAQVFRQN
jgi:hypothetical protein